MSWPVTGAAGPPRGGPWTALPPSRGPVGPARFRAAWPFVSLRWCSTVLVSRQRCRGGAQRSIRPTATPNRQGARCFLRRATGFRPPKPNRECRRCVALRGSPVWEPAPDRRRAARTSAIQGARLGEQGSISVRRGQGGLNGSRAADGRSHRASARINPSRRRSCRRQSEGAFAHHECRPPGHSPRHSGSTPRSGRPLVARARSIRCARSPR